MDPRRLLDLGLTKTSQRPKTRRALVVTTFYPAVERRAVDLIVQRNQPTFACRSILTGSI